MIKINIGTSNNEPILILRQDDVAEVVLSMQEAQQLGVSILVACGAAMTKFEKKP